MFRFTCPACQHGLKARESLSGKKVKCPGCGDVITVPDPGALPHEPTPPGAPVPPALDLPTVPPIAERSRTDQNPSWPAPRHPDEDTGKERGHRLGVSEGAPTPAIAPPPPLPAIEEDPRQTTIIVPVLLPEGDRTPADDRPIAEEPMPSGSGRPDVDSERELDQEAGPSEHTPVPSSRSPAPPPAIAPKHPHPAAILCEAAPMAHHLVAADTRTSYFSPAGYAGPARLAVPFIAPDLRRRLGQVSDAPEPPEDSSSPPSPPADLSAYLVTRMPRWGAVPSQEALTDGAIRAIDPVLAGVFLTHGEADPRVPRAAVRAYLEDPVILAAAIELRDRIIQNWEGGSPPLTTGDLLVFARDLVDDAPTALLLCHNVTRAFAHGSIALSWHLLDPARGEYTDGETVYTAEIPPPDSLPSPPDNPIFFLLFSADDLGVAPSGWARHFALATAVAYAATARLAPDDAPETPFALAWAREVEEVTGSVVDLSQPPSPAYRAWLWAGALSSVSLTGLPPDAEDRSDFARADRRAAAFGLVQAGTGVDLTFGWPTPD
jgi:hypothetical protein